MKENSGTVEDSEDLFQEGIRCSEECDIGKGKQKTF
jgi:hypothetical protein